MANIDSILFHMYNEIHDLLHTVTVGNEVEIAYIASNVALIENARNRLNAIIDQLSGSVDVSNI